MTGSTKTGDDIVTPPIARGALTHRSASAVALLTTALRGRLDLFTYRSILAVPTWGFITEAVVATRAYVTGREAASCHPDTVPRKDLT